MQTGSAGALIILKSLVRRTLKACLDKVVEGPKLKVPVSSASSSRSFHYAAFCFVVPFSVPCFLLLDFHQIAAYMAQADVRRRVGGRQGRWSQVACGGFLSHRGTPKSSQIIHSDGIFQYKPSNLGTISGNHHMSKPFRGHSVEILRATCSARLVLSWWVRTTWMRRRSSDWSARWKLCHDLRWDLHPQDPIARLLSAPKSKTSNAEKRPPATDGHWAPGWGLYDCDTFTWKGLFSFLIEEKGISEWKITCWTADQVTYSQLISWVQNRKSPGRRAEEARTAPGATGSSWCLQTSRHFEIFSVRL